MRNSLGLLWPAYIRTGPVIEALDQQYLLRRLPVLEKPFVLLIVPDGQRLALSGWIDQSNRDEVAFFNRL